MKVLHVITGLETGGAELQLAMLLRRTRHECDVVTLYNPGAVAERILADGTGVADLGMRRNTQLSALPRLRAIISRGGYDVVHAHLFRSQIYARPAAWLAGTPVIVTTEHSIGETHIERRRMTAGVRALYLSSELFSDATIAVSATVRDRLIRWGVPARKVTVIPNGLETGDLAFSPAARARARERFGIAPDDYVIGTLGRLDRTKRVDLTIEAAAPLLGERCKVLIVGRGDDRARLEATAARLGVARHVIFGGYEPDTRAVLSAFDLYVAASAQETFGLSVLEAIASGLPVLYTTCPALDGVHTVLARQVGGTAAAMRAELRREAAAGPRGRAADQNVIDRFGAESTARQVDDLYERLASGRSRSRRRNSARARLVGSPPAGCPRECCLP